MCRLLFYCGTIIHLKSLLIDPQNSLWNQSVNSQRNKWFNFKKRDHIINIDGFGIGWLDVNKKDFVVYKNTIIPYHDENINILTNYLKSGLILGHLRAVKNHKYCKINRDNCHPFQYGNILFMHNGLISNFRQHKHKLMKLIDVKFIDKINGNTDTECIFYYFLTLLRVDGVVYERENFLRCFFLMIENLNRIFANGVISANIVIATPEFSIISRYINTKEEPPSLYINKTNGIIISSEPLEEDGYRMIEKNSCLYVEGNIIREIKM